MKKLLTSLAVTFSLGICGSLHAQSWLDDPKKPIRWDVAMGVTASFIEDIGTSESIDFIGAGASIAGYYVFPSKKAALGGMLDIYDNLGDSHRVNYLSLMVGPAFSYNLTPFGRVHYCIDIGAGYMMSRYFVSHLESERLADADNRSQNMFGIKAGFSTFVWREDMPIEIRLSVSTPVTRQFSKDIGAKYPLDKILGNPLTIGLSVGMRLGKY